jgi:hypothetical protein
MDHEAPKDRKGRAVDLSVQVDPNLDLITHNLRRVYDEVAAEPLPGELLRLLDQLDKKNSDGGSG